MRPIAMLLLAGSLAAQTKLDLRSQSKAVDFQSATFTKPLKSGGILPATCSQGELFFLLTAPPGSNIVACTSANTWSTQGAGGQGGGTSGPVTIENDSAVVGSRGILNLIAGYGLSTVAADTGTQINIQQIVDSAVVMTQTGYQSGQGILCLSATLSGTGYGCVLTPSLTTYGTGMELHWIPDVDSVGGAITLNIDELADRPIKMTDGTTNPIPGDIVAGRMYSLWYDGSTFRIMGNPLVSFSSSTPLCESNSRGRFWYFPAPGGTKDQVSVCAKDIAGAYTWRVLY